MLPEYGKYEIGKATGNMTPPYLLFIIYFKNVSNPNLFFPLSPFTHSILHLTEILLLSTWNHRVISYGYPLPFDHPSPPQGSTLAFVFRLRSFCPLHLRVKVHDRAFLPAPREIYIDNRQ